MIGRIIKYFAYSAYFTVAVVMFAYWSIPTDKVSRFLSHQASAKMKLTVKIDGLTLQGINKATLNDVTIELPVEKEGPRGCGGRRARRRSNTGAPRPSTSPQWAERNSLDW